MWPLFEDQTYRFPLNHAVAHLWQFKARCNNLRLPSCGLVIRKLLRTWFVSGPSVLPDTATRLRHQQHVTALFGFVEIRGAPENNIPSPASSCTICHSSRREIGQRRRRVHRAATLSVRPPGYGQAKFLLHSAGELARQASGNGPRDVNSSRRAKVCFRASPGRCANPRTD